VGSYAQLAFDSADQPWIAYYDATNGNLKVAHYTGAAWEKIVVDSGGDVGTWVDITVSPDDNVHLSYYDASNAQIKYAVGR